MMGRRRRKMDGGRRGWWVRWAGLAVTMETPGTEATPTCCMVTGRSHTPGGCTSLPYRLSEEEGDLMPVQSGHTPTPATTFTAVSSPNPQAVPQPAHSFLQEEALYLAKKRKLQLAILEDIAIEVAIRWTEAAKAAKEEAKAAYYRALTQKLK